MNFFQKKKQKKRKQATKAINRKTKRKRNNWREPSREETVYAVVFWLEEVGGERHNLAAFLSVSHWKHFPFSLRLVLVL